MRKSWHVVAAGIALMLLATGPLAALPPTTTFNLTGVGSGANIAGVYTSPYTGNINGGPSIPVICDDFADDSYVPESWTAYVTPLSTAVSGMAGTPDPTLRWLDGSHGESTSETLTLNGTSYTLSQAQAYTVAAVLAVEILGSVTASADQEDKSFALWELFDYSDASTQLNNAGLGSTDGAHAITDLINAINLASTDSAQVQADVNAVTIYSYDTGATCNGVACPTAPPQEFLTVSMAEPPSPALLGFDLFAVAGLIFFVRRRCVAGSV